MCVCVCLLCDSWLCSTGNKHMNLTLTIISSPINPPPFLQTSHWCVPRLLLVNTHTQCLWLHPVVSMCVRLAFSQSSATDSLMDSGCPLFLSLFIRVFMISAAGRKCWLFNTPGNNVKYSTTQVFCMFALICNKTVEIASTMTTKPPTQSSHMPGLNIIYCKCT